MYEKRVAAVSCVVAILAVACSSDGGVAPANGSLPDGGASSIADGSIDDAVVPLVDGSSLDGSSPTADGSTDDGGLGPFEHTAVVSTAPGSAWDAEPAVAADGAGTVVAAWMSSVGGGVGVRYSISRDEGITWSLPLGIEDTGGYVSGDVSVAADSTGGFHLVWVRTNADKGPGIYLAHLDSQSGRFGNPTTLMAGGSDKPWIRANSIGDLFVIWHEPRFGTPNLLDFAVSTNHGQTFTNYKLNAPSPVPISGQRGRPCVDFDATNPAPFREVFFEETSQPGLFSSGDGISWSNEGSLSDSSLTDDDPDCAVHGSDVWLTFAEDPVAGNCLAPGSNCEARRIVMRHSSDGGGTFGQASAIIDSTTARVIHPQLVRAPSGALVVLYYEDPGAAPRLARAVSRDGGATWSHDALFALSSIDGLKNQANWLGDYFGMTVAGRWVYVAFADNTVGPSHIRVGRFLAP